MVQRQDVEAFKAWVEGRGPEVMAPLKARIALRWAPCWLDSPEANEEDRRLQRRDYLKEVMRALDLALAFDSAEKIATTYGGDAFQEPLLGMSRFFAKRKPLFCIFSAAMAANQVLHWRLYKNLCERMDMGKQMMETALTEEVAVFREISAAEDFNEIKEDLDGYERIWSQSAPRFLQALGTGMSALETLAQNAREDLARIRKDGGAAIWGPQSFMEQSKHQTAILATAQKACDRQAERAAKGGRLAHAVRMAMEAALAAGSARKSSPAEYLDASHERSRALEAISAFLAHMVDEDLRKKVVDGYGAYESAVILIEHMQDLAIPGRVSALEAALVREGAAFGLAAPAFASALKDLETRMREDFWEGLHGDMSRLEAGVSPHDLLAAPLWPQGAPDWASGAWAEMKAWCARFPEDGWSVWTDWYEDRLAGRPVNRTLQIARVTRMQGEGVWEKDVALVNARLKQIDAEYEPHSTQVA